MGRVDTDNVHVHVHHRNVQVEKPGLPSSGCLQCVWVLLNVCWRQSVDVSVRSAMHVHRHANLQKRIQTKSSLTRLMAGAGLKSLLQLHVLTEGSTCRVYNTHVYT